MSQPDAPDQLRENRQVVLILRLVLDRHASLRYGEVLDAQAVSQGRFSSLGELTDAVKEWLDRHQVTAE